MIRRPAAPPRQRLVHDLSPHFVENVNRAIIGVYDRLIAARQERAASSVVAQI
jgi:hypothetical protein